MVTFVPVRFSGVRMAFADCITSDQRPAGADRKRLVTFVEILVRDKRHQGLSRLPAREARIEVVRQNG